MIGGLEVFGPGDPAPQSAKSLALPRGSVTKGAPLPAGTAVVRRTVRVAAGTPGAATVILPCPPGLRVADLLSSRGASAACARTIVGSSRSARVLVEPRPGAASARVSLLCKAPDARGSIVAGTSARKASKAGGATHNVRVERTELLERPNGRGGLRALRPPVRTLGRATDAGWQRIRTDTGAAGWVRASVLRR